MATQPTATKESRHLWVGGLPDSIDESGIKEYFSKFGKVEGVKILPQKYPKIGVAAFIDFYDVKSAVEAKDAKHKLNGQELRTNFKAKQSEKFGEGGAKKSSDDEMEDKKVIEHRSSSGQSDSDSDTGSKSSSDSHSEPDNKTKKKKSGGDATYLKITGLPKRPERVLQDGLYYEYTRYSSTVEIKMYGDDSEKWAVAKFRKADKCREARQQTQGTVLFGNKIKVTPLDTDDFPDGGRDEPSVPSGGNRHLKPDDIDPQATRSLFVGNIPKNINVYDVKDAFQRYGNILDVEIKKMGGTATYGFVLYYDLSSAITAKKYMDGQNIKGNNIRVGFGKGTSSKQLWVDGIDSGTSRQQLEKQMNKYGKVVRLGVDYQRNCAMVQYDCMDAAKKAVESVKGTHIGNSRKLMTDFANRDARAAFFSHVDRVEMDSVHQPFPSPGMYGPGMMEQGFRGGMMMPGMHMMGMGRAGFHPQGHGPPMDYMYDPYMEGGMGYYGGGRPPFHHSGGRGHPVPVGMHPYPPGPGQYEDMDDYEEELAAFKRKRDWEKERDKRKVKKKHHTISSGSNSDTDESSSHRKKRLSKDKHKKTTKKTKEKSKEIKGEDESEGETSSDDGRDKVRLKATQRSKEHRERSKKRGSPRDKDSDSESDSKRRKDSEVVSKDDDSQDGIKQASRNKPKTKSDKKTKDKKQSKPPVSSESPSPSNSVQSTSKTNEKETKPSDKHPDSPPPLTTSPTTNIEEPSHSELKDSIASSEDDHSRKDSRDEVEAPAVETPQSPPPEENKTKKISSVQVESDWSSGEEFKSFDNNDKVSDESKQKVETIDTQSSDGSHTIKSKSDQSRPSSHPSRRESDTFQDPYRASPHGTRSPSDSELVERPSGRSRPAKHLPRRYQVEGDNQEMSRKEMYRGREPRQEKRYASGPSSPSPPPPGFGGHRRRPYYSSPPPELFERPRHRRPRPYSPGPPRGHRSRHSRSPQRYQSPGFKAKSPSPRPRSPISRSKDMHGPRHHHDSPPGEHPRNRYSRRGSPHSPTHRHQHSMSPSFSRSPGRKRPRHRTPSLSPPRRSPLRGHKRDKSPVIEGGRGSPRYARGPGKRAHYSRSPSPKGKYRESGKEEKTEYKRRRVEDPRPKTPPTNQPPSKGPSGHSVPQSAYPAGKQHQSKQAGVIVESQPQQTNAGHRGVESSKSGVKTQAPPPEQQTDCLMDLLRRYPVMWQGHLTLKNDSAAVQLHFLSGNVQLAKLSLPQPSEQQTPTLRIAQRMRLEKTQLEGVGRRMQTESEHCLLLALPCGRDASDVHVQTNALKNTLISYLIQKQAAGIINVPSPQTGFVLHIFPPCQFSQAHLSRVAPDLLSSASDNCHLMIVVATM